jgi:CO/xanthine dehydrogenase Mo-binding subunit
MSAAAGTKEVEGGVASDVTGRTFVRADGIPKVTGQARYTADLSFPGLLEARFLYAGRPSARIVSLDVEEARSVSGVMAVVTQADLPANRYGMCVKDRTLFADGIVRYDGEIVAGVAATSAAAADQAIAKIRVEYDDLEPVLDPERALEPSAPLVHPEWSGDAAAYEGVVRDGNDCGFVNVVKGDVEVGFADAALVVESRYASDMAHAVPIEPHAIVAEWQGERVTIWSSTQVPFVARAGVAETLGIPEGNVRIIVPHLGGGFGGKCDFHFEAHVAALARAARRPVRLVFTRREEFTVPDKVRHPMVMTFKTGVRGDGTISAMRSTVILDTGAYASDSPMLTEVATMMAAGPYRTPNLLVEGHTVYTNKTPCGSVRAPTGPEGCWALESHIDEVAAAAGLDPVEFRMRNLADEGDDGPTGQFFAAIGAKECLSRAVEMIGRRTDGGAGESVGVAVGWWFSMPGATGAYVKLNTDGTAVVVTGAQENGSGAVMGLALLVATELGIDPSKVSFVYQDTDAGPWDGGSAGSQTTFNVGRAVLDAAAVVRRRILELAAVRLEAAVDDLEVAEDSVRVRGAPDRSVTVAAVAGAAMDDGEQLLASAAPLPPPMPENFGGSACVGRPTFPAFAAPAFFAQAARVRVDPETGVVRVLDVVAAHDFGTVINPIGAEGQVEGGIAMGIGLALSEGTVFDADGLGQQVNPDLLDYKLLTAADAPRIRVVFVERPVAEGLGGPFGSKGVGEPPCVPTAGAVANAVAAATGVRMRRLPMTPARVWAAMRDGGDS